MDIFISYKSNDFAKAMDVVSFLESKGRKCWVAPRDVVLSYASDIVDAISKCSVFLVLISAATCQSVHVLNEIEQAYKYYKDGNLAIIPFYLENTNLSPAMDYYLARIQHVNGYEDFEAGELELLDKIEKALSCLGLAPAEQTLPGTLSAAPAKSEEEARVANRYFDVDDKYEKRRLKTEGEFLFRFEKAVFDDLTTGKSGLNGLITCCMFPKAIMEKIDFSRFNKVIGFCYNEKAVFEANYDYRSDKCQFFTQDMEDPDFEEKLIGYMEKMGIDKFDYVDITMGFIDWKNPFKVIKTLKKYMRKGCGVFVRDVDDGVVMAYPDEGKLFAKFKTFYSKDPIAGFRKSGRRIYSYFQKLHASEIRLVHSGIDTSDLTPEEKEKMFFSFFGFIPNDFKICYNEDQSRADFKEIIDWCSENYDALEEAFMDDSLFYNSGYFIYKVII